MNASTLQSLMAVASSMMPEDKLIDLLEESIKVWKKDKTDKNKIDIEFHCMLFMSKTMIGLNKDGLDGVLENMEKFEKAHNLLSPEEN